MECATCQAYRSMWKMQTCSALLLTPCIVAIPLWIQLNSSLKVELRTCSPPPKGNLTRWFSFGGVPSVSLCIHCPNELWYSEFPSLSWVWGWYIESEWIGWWFIILDFICGVFNCTNSVLSKDGNMQIWSNMQISSSKGPSWINRASAIEYCWSSFADGESIYLASWQLCFRVLYCIV
jgi:hypothetical protein